MVCHIQDEEIV